LFGGLVAGVAQALGLETVSGVEAFALAGSGVLEVVASAGAPIYPKLVFHNRFSEG
jgi:hypothetical protein